MDHKPAPAYRAQSSSSFAVAFVLLMAFAPGTSGATIDKADCNTLKAWPAYAQLLKRTKPALLDCAQDCTAYPGLNYSINSHFRQDVFPSCNTDGIVNAMELGTQNILEAYFGVDLFSPQYETVDWDGFSGPLPTQLVRLQRLTTLSLSGNAFTGSLPVLWSNFTSLQYLDLSSNKISGTLPPEWHKMAKLEKLHLSDNTIRGTLPAEWNSFPALTNLYLDHNRVEGSLPPEWGGWTSLSKLILAFNNIRSTLPPEWGGSTSLTTLSFAESTFFTYGALEQESNHIMGTLPPDWGNMAGLQNLYLAGNSINGTLPPEWSNMVSLEQLSIINTTMSGTLPSEWRGLTKLGLLKTSGSRLTGTLPPEWSNWATVQKIEISRNQIRGTLPASWGRLKTLNDLFLQDNHFSGSVPSSWSGMKSLQSLSLSGNKGLAGTLPPGLGAARRFGYLNLYKTGIQFTRKFADSWCSNLLHGGTVRDSSGRTYNPCLLLNHNRTWHVVALLLVAGVLLAAVVVFRFRAAAKRAEGGWAYALMQTPWVQKLQSSLGPVTIVVDIVSDILVLIQVYPKEPEDFWWPFVVLLVVLFVPNIISTLAAWCSFQAHQQGRSCNLLCCACTPACLLPFTISLGIAIPIHAWRSVCSMWGSLRASPEHTGGGRRSHRKAEDNGTATAHDASTKHAARGELAYGAVSEQHVSQKAVSALPDMPPAVRQPCWKSIGPCHLLQVLDVNKHAHLLGFVIAITEDPISVGVTSAFYLINQSNIGQVLQSSTYFFSVCTSLVHMLCEAWRWSFRVGGPEGVRSMYKAFDLCSSSHGQLHSIGSP